MTCSKVLSHLGTRTQGSFQREAGAGGAEGGAGQKNPRAQLWKTHFRPLAPRTIREHIPGVLSHQVRSHLLDQQQESTGHINTKRIGDPESPDAGAVVTCPLIVSSNFSLRLLAKRGIPGSQQLQPPSSPNPPLTHLESQLSSFKSGEGSPSRFPSPLCVLSK